MSRARQALLGLGLGNYQSCFKREPYRRRSAWALLATELETIHSLLDALEEPEKKAGLGEGLAFQFTKCLKVIFRQLHKKPSLPRQLQRLYSMQPTSRSP